MLKGDWEPSPPSSRLGCYQFSHTDQDVILWGSANFLGAIPNDEKA